MRHAPGECIDHYEVLAVLGEGAYAETYQAKDTTTGETVVLKMPNPNLFADPGLFQRYRREAEIARKLDHPGVQRGRDGGKSRTEPYLVLEYVDGDNLRRVMRAKTVSGRLPIATALDWGLQLAEALAYLHRLGIVHRDLKPENILVTADGRLKIADFGTAMLEGARRLTWRVLSDSLGTPDYMSPEQCQGERGDARSDVYAWGIMMYELLSGQVPFRGDNWLAVMAGHLGANPRPLRAARPDVPPSLEGIVMHAMRRHPENRFQSADDLAADLRRVQLGPAAPTAVPARDVASVVGALPGTGAFDTAMPGPGYQAAPAPGSVAGPAYDTTPERPMGHLAAVSSERRLWALVALIAVGFIGIVAVIITLSVVLR